MLSFLPYTIFASGKFAVIYSANSATLGSINSNGSTSAWCLWDNYVMYGFENAEKGTLSASQYLTQVNETWTLGRLVNIYQNAYDLMG